MRILLTSDLHYNIARLRQGTRELVKEVCGLKADALAALLSNKS